MAEPTKVKALTVYDQVGLFFDRGRTEIEKVATKGFDFERVKRIVISAMRRDEKLQACEPESIFRSAIDAVKLGFEPGGPLGHAYLIAYGKKAQMVLGVVGIAELVYRAGYVRSLEAHIVYANDVFDLDYGRENPLIHKPCFVGDRGAPIAAYAIARFVGGGMRVEPMRLDEIEKIMLATPSRGERGPWQGHLDEMRKKTVARRICKLLPKSIELADEFAREDAMEREEEDVTPKKSRKDAPALPPSMPAETFASEGAAQEFAAIQQDEAPAPVEVKAPVPEKPKKAPAPATPEVDTIIEQIEYAETTEDIDGVIESIEKASKRTTNPMNKPTADTLTLKANNRKAEMGGDK